MPPPVWRTRPTWLVCAAAGLATACWTLTLPWHDDDFRLGPAIRLLMAAAGAGLLLLVARRPPGPGGGLVGTVGALGTSVLAYPVLLGLGAAGVAGPLGSVLATASLIGHWPGLALIQVAPVLALGQATGRPSRRWPAVVAAVQVSAFVCTGMSLAGPHLGVAGVVGSVLWFGSFGLAPVATWTGVRGTGGQTRRRAVVAALASLLPVVIIVWCLSLSVFAQAAGWRDDWAVTALMAGFAAATAGCGVLALGATGAGDSFWLRRSTVVTTLNVLLGALTGILGGVGAVLVSRTELAPGWAVVAGAAIAVAVGLPWLRLHRWTARVVDPAGELSSALLLAGELPGRRRFAAEQALRRVADDPTLTVVYRVGQDEWIGTGDPIGAGDPTTGADALAPRAVDDLVRSPLGTDAVVLSRGTDAAPQVVAHTAAPTRVRRLGDCGALLHAALLEAYEVAAGRRAERAAADERSRLARNLHDGLQGRMLGLALHLTLSGRSLADPAARLLLESAVGTLRDLVDDVRALGDGRLPEVLVDEGLHPALCTLLRPLGSTVHLDVPSGRLAADVEATAYFVVSEAVANALKHAAARRVEVRVSGPDAGAVTVTVSDDGCGGADPRLGSGLRGLAERVTAGGGLFVVRDAGPSGTVVEAVLPCAS